MRILDLCPPMVAVVCGLLFTFSLSAQDAVSAKPRRDRQLGAVDTVRLARGKVEAVAVPDFRLPANFRGVTDNELTDPYGVLSPFWEALALTALNPSADSVRIAHIGDSHERGHVFPNRTAELMQAAFPRLSYRHYGINGATCVTFSNDDHLDVIAALRPDLLILSLGTNESYTGRYSASVHEQQLKELVLLLRRRLPDVPILLTTPPGSYNAVGRGRRRSYRVNPRTELAARAITQFADENGLAVWDLFRVFGGARYACLNWKNARLMRPDHVHYLPEGYAIQGEWLFAALAKAYNNYVESD